MVRSEDRLERQAGSSITRPRSTCAWGGTRAGGQRIAAFVEVKFGRDPQLCWALNNKGTGGRRTYDLLLSETTPFDGPGCWYRTTGYQPMRSLALATALMQDHELDEAVFVACAPSSSWGLELVTL